MVQTPTPAEIIAPQNRPKVSPAKALQQAMAEHHSGRLTLFDPNDPSVRWRVYFGEGQIHFAESLMGRQERLSYLTQQYFSDVGFRLTEDWESDYQLICQQWRSHQLPLHVTREVLSTFTQEALIHFLAIPQGYLHYESSVGLDPLLLSTPLRQLILPVRDSISHWVQMRPEISSPFQRPLVRDRDRFLSLTEQVPEVYKGYCNLPHLSDWFTEGLSFYELATRYALDVKDLVTLVHPLIRNGAISVQPHQGIVQSVRPQIVCVDDSPTIQHLLKLSLESSGYAVHSLLDPTQALAAITPLLPDLIVLDVEMPKLDGYELCRHLRQIEALRAIPIIMLTGREGFIDRVRARMAGCTAYLAKPVHPQALLTLVHKLTQQAHPAA